MAADYNHYRIAERLIEALKTVEVGSPKETALIAEAQVHATLALADAMHGVAGRTGVNDGR